MILAQCTEKEETYDSTMHWTIAFAPLGLRLILPLPPALASGPAPASAPRPSPGCPRQQWGSGTPPKASRFLHPKVLYDCPNVCEGRGVPPSPPVGKLCRYFGER